MFPWDEDGRYPKAKTMADAPSLLLWHTNMKAQEMVDGVNCLIDERNRGNQVLYDYSAAVVMAYTTFAGRPKNIFPPKRIPGSVSIRMQVPDEIYMLIEEEIGQFLEKKEQYSYSWLG